MTISDEMRGRLRSLIGKKFIIVIIASVAMFMGKIGGLEWVGIVTAYLAADQYQTKTQGKLP